MVDILNKKDEEVDVELLRQENKILKNFVKNIAYRTNSNIYFQRGTAQKVARDTLNRLNHIDKASLK
jgi:hypothetical protein